MVLDLEAMQIQRWNPGPGLKSMAEFPLLLMILQMLPVLPLPRGVPLLLVMVPARDGERLWREDQSLQLRNLWAIESIPEIGEVFLSLPLSLSYSEGVG